MSLRFQADKDLNRAIVDGVRRRDPAVDFRTAEEAGLDRLKDRVVLEQATSEGRVLVSCDKRTMLPLFYKMVAEGRSSPGLLLVIPQDAPTRAIALA